MLSKLPWGDPDCNRCGPLEDVIRELKSRAEKAEQEVARLTDRNTHLEEHHARAVSGVLTMLNGNEDLQAENERLRGLLQEALDVLRGVDSDVGDDVCRLVKKIESLEVE